MKKPKTNFHYIAINGMGWKSSDNIDTAMLGLTKMTGKVSSMKVYKVPLPEKTNYDIDEYVPEVEGTILVMDVKAIHQHTPVILS